MASIQVRSGLNTRKVRATLTEANGAPADLTAGGTAVTLHLTRADAPFTALTRSATIDVAASGKVYYQIQAADWQDLPKGTRWWAWWTVAPLPNGSDTGSYPEGTYDVWEVTL